MDSVGVVVILNPPDFSSIPRSFQKSGTFTWPRTSCWHATTGLCSAMDDAELQAVLILEEKGSLCPEKENAAS